MLTQIADIVYGYWLKMCVFQPCAFQPGAWCEMQLLLRSCVNHRDKLVCVIFVLLFALFALEVLNSVLVSMWLYYLTIPFEIVCDVQDDTCRYKAEDKGATILDSLIFHVIASQSCRKLLPLLDQYLLPLIPANPPFKCTKTVSIRNIGE